MARNLLVVGPSEQLRDSLAGELSPQRFRIWFCRPGARVLRALNRSRPEIAIIDGIDARPEAAQLEIALVKAVSPEARVIAVSRHSSGADASVIEQGVFYYMAGLSEAELLRAVESAAGDDPSETSTP